MSNFRLLTQSARHYVPTALLYVPFFFFRMRDFLVISKKSFCSFEDSTFLVIANNHYSERHMNIIASQFTGNSTVRSTAYWVWQQRNMNAPHNLRPQTFCLRDNSGATFQICFMFFRIDGPNLWITSLDFGRLSSWHWLWIFKVKYLICSFCCYTGFTLTVRLHTHPSCKRGFQGL